MTVYLLFIYISTASSKRVACLLADVNKSVIIVLFYAIITQKQDFSFCFRYPLYLPVICNTQQKRSKKTILQQKTGKLLGKEKTHNRDGCGHFFLLLLGIVFFHLEQLKCVSDGIRHWHTHNAKVFDNTETVIGNKEDNDGRPDYVLLCQFIKQCTDVN